MHTLANTKTNQNVSTKWMRTSPKESAAFTCDNVIDAYQKGKQEQKDLQERLILDKLERNVELTWNYANEIYEHLREQGLNPKNSFLRINNWDSFNILFIIPEEQLLNKKIYDIYDFLSDFEEERRSDLFHFSISLCGYTEEFNDDKVFADGFIFSLLKE